MVTLSTEATQPRRARGWCLKKDTTKFDGAVSLINYMDSDACAKSIVG
jgi:hypothetical protein